MKKKDVVKTLKKGVFTDTSYIKVYALLDMEKVDRNGVQAAAVVGKKIHASAVQRHKYQRWIREAVRHYKSSLPDNLMLVLIAKTSINRVKNYKQVQESVFSTFTAKKGFLV